MNEKMMAFARNELEEGLAQLPDSWSTMFKRMYSPDNLGANMTDVIDSVPADKLDWAMQQVQRSLDKLSARK